MSATAESDATTAGRTTTTTTTSTTPGLPIGAPTVPSTIPSTSTTVVVAPPDSAILRACPKGQTGPGVPFCFTPLTPPLAPTFAAADLLVTTHTLHVVYNEPVDCSSVSSETYTVASEQAPLALKGSCVGSTNVEVLLAIPDPAPITDTLVGVVKGTVEDAHGTAQSTKDTIVATVSGKVPAPPSQPKFAAAAAVPGTLVVHVLYNEPVTCDSVANEQYTIAVVAPATDRNSWVVPTVECGAPGTSNVDVKLTLTQLPSTSYFQPGQTGTVTVANGAVKDANGNAQSKTDSISWYLAPPS